MAFDLEIWKNKVAEKLHDWKTRMDRAGVHSIYAFLSATALLPVLEAARVGGDWAALAALGGVAGSVGGNLLANQIQAWKDEADGAKQLEKQASENQSLREALDEILKKLEVLPQAEQQLGETDRQWFAQVIQSELARLGSSVHYEVKLIGERAVVVEGNLSHATIFTGDLIQHIGTQQTVDPQALRVAYLSSVFKNTSLVSLSGIDRKAVKESESQLSLSAVYTALLTLSQEIEERKAPGMQIEIRLTRHLPALEQLNRYNHLVLLGDPGGGKTTFINFVAMCLAGHALGEKDINLKLLQSPLPQEQDRFGGREKAEEPKPQPWDHGALLPVRVILRDFAARGLPEPGAKATVEHLWNFLAKELQEISLGDYVHYLRKELLEKGGLLLVDGLDEVPEAEQRSVQIKQVVEGFAASFRKCRILVTSRTYAYQQQDWRLSEFNEAVLAPFSRAQISQFVERWYDHFAALGRLTSEEAKGRAELLKRAIFTSDRLMGLAERPLLLTLMASLHAWRGGTLPEKREELYNDTVDLLLDWWESHRIIHDAQGKILVIQPSLTEWLKVKDRQEVRDLLNELAFQAHASQPELTGTADVAEDKLVMGLMHLSNNPDINPKTLMEYLSNRAGLLVPRGVGVYTFPHRTFQEYLAACYLTDHDYPAQIAKLICQDFERWREVALLAGAKAARGSASTIWSLVDELCYDDLKDKACKGTQLWNAHLAGQALVETANLNRLSESNQLKVERVRHWLVHILQKSQEEGGLPVRERALAGDNLGKLGDPRLAVTTLEAMEFCLVPSGSFRMGSKKKDDPDTQDDEKSHEVKLPDYWVSLFPVTNAQFNVFVNAGCYGVRKNWKEAQGAKVWQGGKVKGSWDNVPRDRPLQFGEPFGLPNHPVVGITWYEALAFTRWLAEAWQQQGFLPKDWKVQLPSEAEWEKAARGGLKLPENPVVVRINNIVGLESLPPLRENPRPYRIYPWEGDFDPDRANIIETGIGSTSAVGCFPGGASPYGILDMSGNVWEWTRSLYKDYPYDSKDGRENLDSSDGRVLRGGAFRGYRYWARCAYRYWDLPDYGFDYIGFRVVVSPA